MMITPHFAVQEFACPHCGETAEASVLLALALALEKFRTVVGRPVAIDSSFRCAIHNLAIGGEPDSEHLLGAAADIRAIGMSARQMYIAATQVKEFGGIGVNDLDVFIHVDLRPRLGTDLITRWCYNRRGRAIPWHTDGIVTA